MKQRKIADPVTEKSVKAGISATIIPPDRAQLALPPGRVVVAAGVYYFINVQQNIAEIGFKAAAVPQALTPPQIPVKLRLGQL